MKFKKGEIVFAKSGDYGNCIIQLVSRITKNVKGEIMKSPIWYAHILDSDKDRDLVEFMINAKDFSHLLGFFEYYDNKYFMEHIDSPND